MIINISIQNFGPIKDRQVLSFEADNSNHLEEHYVIKKSGKNRLLKLALIFGGNASGKTSILNALDFLRKLVLNPLEKKTDIINFTPFLFDDNTPKLNSIIAINFIQKNIRYSYEVEFNVNSITREELNYYHPNKARVFKRTTNVEKQLSKIVFGSKIKSDSTIKKILESNTLWNNTVLGGFLKTNMELDQLKNVTDWFKSYLKKIIFTNTELDSYITNLIFNSHIKKDIVLSILKKADLNISDIIIQEEEKEIPDGFLEFMEKQLHNSSERIKELREKGKFKLENVEFLHRVSNKDYSLPFDLESEGTKRYYGFAGLLSLLIKDSIIFPIDELEASLHPDLFIHFLLSFLVNSTESQIIATSHNRELLSNKDLFRNDVIWFTEKNEKSETVLYSLADFDTNVIRDTSNILNAYKSGKLGAIPNLGDLYIDVNHEEI